MNKKSNIEFLAELNEKKPNVEALEEYVSKDTDIKCRCKLCGYEWITTPRKILKNTLGTGCKKCSMQHRNSYTRRSKEGLQKELDSNKRFIKIIGNYTGMTKKIEVECLVCGEIWNPRPDHLLEGHGCPKCRGSKLKGNDEFISQLKNINNYIDVLEKYKNSKTKVQCRCRICGYVWNAIPTKLLSGNGCPNCDSKNKTSFSEQAILYYIRMKQAEAIGRYKLPQSQLECDIFIPNEKIAIEYDGVYWHKNKKCLENQKYRICKKEGIKLIRIREGAIETDDADYVINREAPYNYKTLDNVIRNVLEYLKYKNVEVDSKSDAYAIREQYYLELKENSLGKKYPLLIREWLQEKNGSITPFMVSAGCNDKYWWKCSICGNEWQASVCDRSLAKKGCKKCADRRNADLHLKSQIVFEEEAKEKSPSVKIIGVYKGNHKIIEVECKKCGNTWNTYPSTLLRGRSCPLCYRYIKTGRKKTHVEFTNEMLKIQPNLIFLEEYQGRTKKIKAKCRVCNEFLEPRPADLLHGYYKKHLHNEEV